MPSPELSSLLQEAVLWAYNGKDNWGRVEVTQPVEVMVRRVKAVGRQQSSTTDTQTDTGTMYQIDREVPLNSLLWFGKLCDLPTVPTPLNLVKNYMETPDVKDRECVRSVTLVRYAETLPQIVGD